MSFLIKINRSTIRKNPDAGSTTYQYAGPKQPIELTVIGQDKWNGPWIKRVWTGNILTSFEEVPEPESKDLIFSVSQKSNICTLHTICPQPEYYFEYENPTIVCNNCGESFLLSKLEQIDDEFGYSERVCPHCGIEDCVDLRYENLTEIDLTELKSVV